MAVQVNGGDAKLRGELGVPAATAAATATSAAGASRAGARGMVLVARGGGSPPLGAPDRALARELNSAGLATLLLDLLTVDEERVDAQTTEHRFDIGLLTRRLLAAIDWLSERPEVAALPLGIFGAGTCAAAALEAAAERPMSIRALVSAGGRPDLAGAAIGRVRAPVLLLVGGADELLLQLNQEAAQRLRTPYLVHVVPGATNLLAEPDAAEEVAGSAAAWFTRAGHR